jgi:Predicted membrane protein
VNRIVRFLCVGAVGFFADAAMLALLTSILGIEPLIARCLSIAFALMVTWLLNRTLTFGSSSRGMAIEGARYGGVGVATSLFNYAIYAALLLAAPATPPLVALVVASAAATLLSYLGYSRLVFDR